MSNVATKVRNLYDRMKIKYANGVTTSNYNYRMYQPAKELKVGVPDYELIVVKCMLSFSLSVILLKILYKYGGYLAFSTTFFKSIWTPLSRFVFEINWLPVPLLVGVTATVLTYVVVYITSDVPSVNPPSPFSRINSGKSRWQLCYIYPFVNGVIFFFATLLLNEE